MYMDIGAMFLLQNPSGCGYDSADGGSATHQATQSVQCPPSPKFSGQILFDPGWTHLATVPVAHPAGGSGTHACQQYTSPSAHEASSARTRLLRLEVTLEDVSPSAEGGSWKSSPHAAAARTAEFASEPGESPPLSANAAAAKRRHSPNVISTSSTTSSTPSSPPRSFDDDRAGPRRPSLDRVSGAGNTIRPNHALCCPSDIDESDISCVGTAMDDATSPSGYHARAPSPSITSTASGGRIGWRPPRVRPRDEPPRSIASSRFPPSVASATRSAGVITTATPTSVCSPFPRRPGRGAAS
mmetsp:Transcript_14217/g.60115  ORF Transcript_14217/g.60115 Transcript_14217/m.60115 type:complete len:299 (-) Transcript_14217:900-1796(-)